MLSGSRDITLHMYHAHHAKTWCDWLCQSGSLPNRVLQDLISVYSYGDWLRQICSRDDWTCCLVTWHFLVEFFCGILPVCTVTSASIPTFWRYLLRYKKMLIDCKYTMTGAYSIFWQWLVLTLAHYYHFLSPLYNQQQNKTDPLKSFHCSKPILLFCLQPLNQFISPAFMCMLDAVTHVHYTLRNLGCNTVQCLLLVCLILSV